MNNDVEVEKDVHNEENKNFSDAEIKKRLKQNSKNQLINIIVNLSNRIDELKEKHEQFSK
jgi:hypothetical protein